jgi:RNA polymerase primary sigma factor
MKINVKNGNGSISNPNNREIYNKYLCEVNKFRPLSREEEVSLFKQIKKGDKKAFDKIYKHNLLFVLTVARQYNKLINNSTLCLEDLISEGNIGLHTAINKFDYSSGNKFISYAVWWIKQSINVCINENNKNIRIPSSAKRKYNNYLKTQNKLEQSNYRVPSIIEVFEAMVEDGSVSSRDELCDVEELIKMNSIETSLNMFVSEEETTELINIIKNDDDEPYTILANDERTRITYEMLSVLPEHGKEIISDYFGLFDREELSITKLSKKYKLSGQSIRNRIEKYLKLLRRKNVNKTKYFVGKPNTKHKFKIREIKKLYN